MSNIATILEKLKDGANTVIDFPDRNGEDLRYNSVFKPSEGNRFELIFPPDSWKESDLEMGVECLLAVKHKGNTVNLVARLDDLVNERRLAFTAKESVRPEALREYFRVSMNIEIQASYLPGPKEVARKPWKMMGTTIDLSGGGVLALMPEKPLNQKRIMLDLKLPEPQGTVHSLAHVVRTYRLRKKRFQVAFHFDDMEQKTRDAIIAGCLQEQRRQLRENVQVE